MNTVPTKLCDFCERMTGATLVMRTITHDLQPQILVDENWGIGIEDVATARVQAADEQLFRQIWPTKRITDYLRKQCHYSLCDPAPTEQFVLHRSLRTLCMPDVTAKCHLCYHIHSTVMGGMLNDEKLTSQDVKSNIEYKSLFILPQINAEFRCISFLLLPDLWSLEPREYTLRFKESENAVFFSSDLRTRTLRRLRTWLHNCKNQHAECNRKREMFRPALPSRLLEIDFDAAQPQVRLVETANMRYSPEYATLSHCWGPKGLRVKLLQSNKQKWLTAIPYSELPKTFQEAITFTHSLEFRYLWIDALCIIQDSVADWENEACRMASVYSGSEFTIAATASSSGNDGLCVQNYYETPCLFRPNWSGSFFSGKMLLAGRSVLDPYNYWVADGPLNQRAWVYQEGLLSPRMIHFTASQIFWECSLGCEQELATEGNCTELQSDYTTDDNLSAKDALRGDHWLNLVKLYSQTALTKREDRLMALAGVADAFSQLHSHRAEDYLAGIWRGDIKAQLLWVADRCDSAEPFALTSYFAPSWSWASATTPINWPCNSRLPHRDEVEWDPDFEIKDAVVKLRGKDHFGALEGGHLRIRSRLLFQLEPDAYGSYTIRAGSQVLQATDFYCSCRNRWTECPSFQEAVLLPTVVHVSYLYFLVLVRVGKGTYKRLPQMVFSIAYESGISKLGRQVTNKLEKSMYIEQLPDGRYGIIII